MLLLSQIVKNILRVALIDRISHTTPARPTMGYWRSSLRCLACQPYQLPRRCEVYRSHESPAVTGFQWCRSRHAKKRRLTELSTIQDAGAQGW
jgi:hypothetical protein